MQHRQIGAQNDRAAIQNSQHTWCFSAGLRTPLWARIGEIPKRSAMEKIFIAIHDVCWDRYDEKSSIFVTSVVHKLGSEKKSRPIHNDGIIGYA